MCITCDTLILTILSSNGEGLTWVYLYQDYLKRKKDVSFKNVRIDLNMNLSDCLCKTQDW